MRLFIDGENFRHRIVDVLLDEGYLTDSEQPFEFDVRALIAKAMGGPVQEINYYTSQVRQPAFDIPDELHQRIDSIQRVSHQWTESLTRQNIQVVVGGNLKVHDSARCMHCHKKTLVLQEKGVDVRVASDIVLAATIEEMAHIIIGSSDADMIPALEVAKRADTKISYICFDEDLNRAVAAIADETKSFTRQDIIDCYTSLIS